MCVVCKMNLQLRITKYADEPHPNEEHAWKSWWVKKCFDLQEPLTAGALEWIHQCWQMTKALWHTDDVTRRHNDGGER